MALNRILGLMLIALFYGAYFAKQIGMRRRGILSSRLASRDKHGRVFALELALLLSTLLTGALQLLCLLMGWEAYAPAPLQVGIGACLAAAGVAFFLLAMGTMRDNWRAGLETRQRTQLVTGGLYRHSRNPAFVGFDLLYIGIALLCPSIWLAALSAASIGLLHLQILQEERHMQALFGDAYRQYRARTPRYLLIRSRRSA